MADDRRRIAQAELERVNATLKAMQDPPWFAQVIAGIYNHVFPGVGTAINRFHKWLGCPPLELYKSQLEAFLDGRRDTLPSEPDVRKFYVPR